MSDRTIASIEKSLADGIEVSKQRERALWLELGEMIERKAMRLEVEKRIRADEDARENEIRAELAVLRDEDEDISW